MIKSFLLCVIFLSFHVCKSGELAKVAPEAEVKEDKAQAQDMSFSCPAVESIAKTAISHLSDPHRKSDSFRIKGFEIVTELENAPNIKLLGSVKMVATRRESEIIVSCSYPATPWEIRGFEDELLISQAQNFAMKKRLSLKKTRICEINGQVFEEGIEWSCTASSPTEKCQIKCAG